MCPLNPLVYKQKKLKCILITYPCAKLIIITLLDILSLREEVLTPFLVSPVFAKSNLL